MSAIYTIAGEVGEGRLPTLPPGLGSAEVTAKLAGAAAQWAAAACEVAAAAAAPEEEGGEQLEEQQQATEAASDGGHAREPGVRVEESKDGTLTFRFGEAGGGGAA